MESKTVKETIESVCVAIVIIVVIFCFTRCTVKIYESSDNTTMYRDSLEYHVPKDKNED